MKNISDKIHKLVVPLSLLSMFCIYLVFALPSLYRPLVADDGAVFARESELAPNKDALWHPPFYFDILRFLNNTLNLTKENLRLFGVFCFGLNFVLIYLLSKEIAKSWKVGLLACLLFATHPLAIQGSLVLDIDNTILAVLSTLFVFYFSKFYKDRLSIHDCFMGLFFFVLLWSKLSTPLILIASLFLFFIFKLGLRTALEKALLIGGIGTGLFLVIWAFYAKIYNLPYFGVLERSLFVIGKGAKGVSLPATQELLLRTVKISLWLGPHFLLFWFLMFVLQAKAYFCSKLLEIKEFYLLYISLIFVVYIFVGGTIFGFAKYQYPILPILSILIADFLFKLNLRFDWKNLSFYGLTGLFFIYLMTFGVGDLIYGINYTLRKLAIFTPALIPEFIKSFTFKLGLYFLPLILGVLYILVVNKGKDLLKLSVLLLLTLGLFANLSLDAIQVRADYFTTYCYGRNITETKQMENLFKRLYAKNPSGIIIGPEDVLYNAGIERSEYNYSVLWNDKQGFLEAIQDERVICVAYGFTWNAISTYKNIFFNQAVQRLLQDRYELLQLGTFSVWLRK